MQMINTDTYRETVKALISQMSKPIDNTELRHGTFLKIAGNEYNLRRIEYNAKLQQIYFVATDRPDIKVSAELSLKVVKTESKKNIDSPDIFLIVRNERKTGYYKTPLLKIRRGGLYFELIGDDENVEHVASVY